MSLVNPEAVTPVQNVKAKTSSHQSSKDSIGNYKVIKSVGKGAFGEVYLALSKATDKQFAVKSISKDFLMSQKKEHYVFQERLILKSFDSPNIVKLYKTFQDDTKIYFIMEYLPNGGLSRMIRKQSFIIRKVHVTRNCLRGRRNRSNSRRFALSGSHPPRPQTRESDVRSKLPLENSRLWNCRR